MSLSDFAYWLAASDKRILAECPRTEAIKHRIIGTSVLIPMSTGFCAMWFYAGKLLGTSGWVPVAAVVWSLMIMTIDRLMLACYRPFAPWWKRWWQISLRAVLVLLIALSIAHPLCLNQFASTIKDTYQSSVEKKRRVVDDNLKARKAANETAHAESRKVTEEKRSHIPPDPASKEQVDKRSAELRDLSARVTPELTAARADEEAINEPLVKENATADWYANKAKEYRACLDSELKTGTNDCTEDGRIQKAPVKGPRTTQLSQWIEETKKKEKESRDRSEALKQRQREAHAKVVEEEKKARVASTTKNNENAALLEAEIEKNQASRKKLLAAIEVEEARATETKKKEDEQADKDASAERARLDTNAAGPQDPMQETIVLWKVVTTGGDEMVTGPYRWVGGFFSFGIVFSVLVLLDSIPVLMKISSPGPYDRRLHLDEEESRLLYEARRVQLPDHVNRRVQDQLHADTRRNLEQIHRAERQHNEAMGIMGTPDFS